MKALSLRQPWAELILQGRKTIETRTWNTRFRGRFLIHAAKQCQADDMCKFGFSSLPTGCIVGVAEIIDIICYTSKDQFNTDFHKHLFSVDNWTQSRYGYILNNVQRISHIPYSGKLNFFEIPDPVLNL
ncbi:MAG: ASCH domain-containing protein [Nanoarchaeota archaeon]